MFSAFQGLADGRLKDDWARQAMDSTILRVLVVREPEGGGWGGGGGGGGAPSGTALTLPYLLPQNRSRRTLLPNTTG